MKTCGEQMLQNVGYQFYWQAVFQDRQSTLAIWNYHTLRFCLHMDMWMFRCRTLLKIDYTFLNLWPIGERLHTLLNPNSQFVKSKWKKVYIYAYKYNEFTGNRPIAYLNYFESWCKWTIINRYSRHLLIKYIFIISSNFGNFYSRKTFNIFS